MKFKTLFKFAIHIIFTCLEIVFLWFFFSPWTIYNVKTVLSTPWGVQRSAAVGFGPWAVLCLPCSRQSPPGEFPGGPVLKTLHFQHGDAGHWFDLWLGNWCFMSRMLHVVCCGKKKENSSLLGTPAQAPRTCLHEQIHITHTHTHTHTQSSHTKLRGAA